MPAIKNVFDLLGDGKVELFTEKASMKNKRVSYDKKWFENSKAKLLRQFVDEKRAKLIMSRMKKQMKKQYQMAYINYVKVWCSVFLNIVSAEDRVQFMNPNQLKLKVKVIFRKMSK